jgi:integrase
MGVFDRSDSPYWWLYLETAPKGERKVNTKIRIGWTAEERKDSRAKAELLYHTRMLQVADRRNGMPVTREPVLFKVFAPWYDTNVIEHHKGKERERGILARLVEAFGELHLEAITKDVVIAWRTTRRKTPTVIPHFGGPRGKKRVLPPPSARTVNREVDVLQQILAAAVTAGHLAVSPLFGLKDLKIVKPRRRTMSEEEERRLLPQLSPEDKAIFLVGLDALARMGDVLDLRREDRHGDTLDIRDPKNGEPLTVPISTRLQEALDALSVDPDEPEWYFPGRRGAATERDRRGGYAKALKRACERAGVPYGRAKGGLTFHWATRRTGATRMIRRGGEKAIGVTQRIGGWKKAEVLIGIYQETITAEMRAAVNTVAPQRKKAAQTLRLVTPPAESPRRRSRKAAS